MNARDAARRSGGRDAAAEFERLYRAQVDAVTAYFARRSADPQTVADLTADTFVQAIASFGSFDPARGSGRAWLFGIAKRIYAGHCEARSRQHERVARLAGRRELLDRNGTGSAGRRGGGNSSGSSQQGTTVNP